MLSHSIDRLYIVTDLILYTKDAINIKQIELDMNFNYL